MSPDWPLETSRLTLRPFVEGDFDAVYAMRSDPDVALYLYQGPLSPDETRSRLERNMALSAWTAEVGFVFDPRHQGKGFATEAARALVEWAFGFGGFHRVIGRTEARNVASARVLEKLGMRLEAHFVENEWVKGEWQSELVYAILDREWRGL